MLEKFSLDSLSRTKVGVEFGDALDRIKESLSLDSDVEGERSITLTISFKKNAAGERYKTAEMRVSAKTPRRSIKSIATLDDDGNIKIDTLSADARQPSLLEAGSDKVTPLKAANGGQ